MGTKYATEKSYGGQRASLGQMVVIRTANLDGLRPGMIVGIDEETDEPEIRDMRDLSFLPGLPMIFCQTASAEGAEQMPVGRWTWPPRV